MNFFVWNSLESQALFEIQTFFPNQLEFSIVNQKDPLFGTLTEKTLQIQIGGQKMAIFSYFM